MAHSCEEPECKPNFLVFITDMQRWDTLGCYGNDICRTPHINALAREGVRFDNCFVQNPICSPSRATLMTGQYPSSHGVRANGINLRDDLPKVTTELAAAGYRTGVFGKVHLNSWGAPRAEQSVECGSFWRKYDHIPTPYMGFDTVKIVCGHNETFFADYMNWLLAQCPEGRDLLQFERALDEPRGGLRTWHSALPVELHCTHWVAEQTTGYLHEVKDSPFFVQCSFPDPHPSWCPPAPYCYMYDPDDVPSPPRRDSELADMPPHFEAIHRGTHEWIPY